MGDTAIEWTDKVWNPTRGCSRVSEGCRHCYAERVAARFAKPGELFHGFAKVVAPRDALDRVGGRRNGWTGRVELIPEKLGDPLRWRKPARVFVNSMSDLFHEALSDADIARAFGTMFMAKQHTFQVLTKRPRRMLEWFARCGNGGGLGWITHDNTEPARAYLGTGEIVGLADSWPLPNVWLGVSVEDERTADERIPLLLETPAAVRFISYEPALGPVDLRAYMAAGVFCDPYHDARLDWVIVGGESGPGARPFDPAWARAVVAQCRAAGVPAFVKQMGAHVVFGEEERPRDWPEPLRWRTVGCSVFGIELNHPKGGDPAEWPEDLRVREFPA